MFDNPFNKKDVQAVNRVLLKVIVLESGLDRISRVVSDGIDGALFESPDMPQGLMGFMLPGFREEIIINPRRIYHFGLQREYRDTSLRIEREQVEKTRNTLLDAGWKMLEPFAESGTD